MTNEDPGAAVRGEPSVEDARNKVMDALCGYGEAMFLKGNPYNKPDQRLDQKAVWQALDNYAAAIRADERRQLCAVIEKVFGVVFEAHIVDGVDVVDALEAVQKVIRK